MPPITLIINGRPFPVSEGTTVAAAVLAAGFDVFASGRGPLCGMGICFDCRLTIDGHPHERTCQLLCREGMKIDVPIPA